MTEALPEASQPPLFNWVADILDQARSNVVRTVSSQMVIAYWLIGREIVEEEQQGRGRAEYGKQLIEELSERLTKKYGRGVSAQNLWNMRTFYLMYSARLPDGHDERPGRPRIPRQTGQ